MRFILTRRLHHTTHTEPDQHEKPRARLRAAISAALAGLGLLTSTLAQPGMALTSGTDLPGSATSPAAARLRPPSPDLIEINSPGLHPEGIEWDGAHDRFLVSSATTGSVTAVDDDGSLSTFADGERVTSSLGTTLDRRRGSHGRLLVTGANFAAVADDKVKGEAKLAIYDLKTGHLDHLVNLARLLPMGRHLANDVTIDHRGNAYITDSLSPAIYKVTPAGKASVLTVNPRFRATGTLGLNGIAYVPRGYLLVAMGEQNTLYRVPLSNPDEATEVLLPRSIDGDGLTLLPGGDLVVAAPLESAVLRLASSDDWHSARVVAQARTTKDALTTNTTQRGAHVYGVNAHLNKVGSQNPWPSFEIFKVRWHRDR